MFWTSKPKGAGCDVFFSTEGFQSPHTLGSLSSCMVSYVGIIDVRRRQADRQADRQNHARKKHKVFPTKEHKKITTTTKHASCVLMKRG